MATEVHAEVIEESSLRETENGYELDVAYRVEGIEAPTLDEMKYLALQEVPSRGEPHPTLPISGLVVRSREAAAESNDLVSVTLQYRTQAADTQPQLGDDPQIEVGGRVTQTQTNVDKDGNKLLVSFSGDSDHLSIAETVATVALQVPVFTLRITRRETQSPASKAATYVGRVNSVEWYGQPAHQWLCEAIVGRSDDGGDTYIVNHEFGYNEGESGNGWAAHVFAKDPETGEIPGGVSLGDGEEFFDVQKEADFNDLDLS